MTHVKNGNAIPRYIYLDCTETYFNCLNTGIQRVVRNIAGRAKYLTKRCGVPCIPVFALNGEYLPLSALIFYIKYRMIGRRILNQGDIYYHKIANIFKEKPSIIEPEQYSHETSSSVRLVIQTMARMILDNPSLLIYFFAYFRLLRPKTGELVVIVDSYWDRQEVIRAAENAKRAGATVIPVIHDLIPLMYPAYCEKIAIRNFANAFQKLMQISSGMLTVSGTSQKDIDAYLQKFYPERAVPTDFFYLGADFLQNRENWSEGTTPPRFKQLLHGPFFLMVGTIEPRKGHDVVLAAFENLWKNGDVSRLCIVGQVGWKCSHILRKMETSPYRDLFLFFAHDVNDDELGFLYQRAQGVIFASHTEGFGLPMVEAMQYGLPVIASDIPIFREIAGSYPKYFRVGDADDLEQVIKNFNGSSATAPKPPQWLTWDESAKIFMDRLLLLYQRVQK